LRAPADGLSVRIAQLSSSKTCAKVRHEIEAMRALGIDSQEDLFLLKAQARLPMPRRPDGQTDDMVEQLKALPTA